MESIKGRNCSDVKRSSPDESLVSRLEEDISSLLSRWNGLQLAIVNEWGGTDSLQKSHQLASDLLSWFSHSKEPVCVEDIENLLHESLLLSFNTEIEDGSIELVAEQLMIIHEEYLQGNQLLSPKYASIGAIN